MSDVAIIGIGIHPFGRTEGMTGLQPVSYTHLRATETVLDLV